MPPPFSGALAAVHFFDPCVRDREGVHVGCYFTSAASLGQRLFPKLKFAQYASAVGIVGR
jgi:hypothetical protein